jgi:AraC family transcriptional regulator, arabinose operon regulatory protein
MDRYPMFLESGKAGEGRNDHRLRNEVYRPTGTSTWLLEYTVGGRGIARQAGREVALLPGSLLMYEAGAPQDYVIDDEHGYWHHIWFCFDPHPHWRDLLRWPEVCSGVYLMQVPEEGPRDLILGEMNRALEFSRGIHVRRCDLVMNVLEKVLIHCDSWNPLGSAARRDDRIRSVLEYINEHLTDKLCITTLARVCSLSPSRLSHLFRDQMGQAPIQYIEARRLDRAKELLMMTAKPVAQISEECGFCSPFYFSRVFKARTGLAPRAARQRYASKP